MHARSAPAASADDSRGLESPLEVGANAGRHATCLAQLDSQALRVAARVGMGLQPAPLEPARPMEQRPRAVRARALPAAESLTSRPAVGLWWALGNFFLIQPALAKPLLRGVLHQVGFGVSLVLGALLVVGSAGASEHVGAAVFAASVAACFGLSALSTV